MHSISRIVVAGVVSVLCLGIVPAQSPSTQSSIGHTQSTYAGQVRPMMVGCCR
jgi:hypothetical protein